MFRWENEVSNPNRATYEFEYYIGGPTVPEGAYYKKASTWDDIPITQIDGGEGNVIHIRYKSGTDYSLANTRLVVRPVDNAGNTAEVSFPLNYAYDNIGPRIKREIYSRTFDSLSQKGKMTATINIRDVLDKVTSVWLQWVNDGDAPEDVWTPIEYNTVGVNKSFSIEKAELATDVNHRYDLYIKTGNEDGTETIESFDFDYDLKKPGYDLEFISNPDDILEKHSVIFKEPENSTDVTTITMIKCENSSEPDHYWVKTSFTSTGADGSKNIDDIFGIPPVDEILNASAADDVQPSDYFTYWRRCSVTENVYSDEFGVLCSYIIEQVQDLGVPMFSEPDLISSNQESLSNLFNKGYGPKEVKFIAAYNATHPDGLRKVETPSVKVLYIPTTRKTMITLRNWDMFCPSGPAWIFPS